MQTVEMLVDALDRAEERFLETIVVDLAYS